MNNNKKTTIPKGFVSQIEATNIIGFKSDKLKKIVKLLNITTAQYNPINNSKTVYSKKELENYKQSYDNFWNTHILIKDLEKLCDSVSLAKTISKKINRIAIPPEYANSCRATNVFLLSDVNEYLEDYKSKYITASIACEVLNINRRTLSKVIEESNLITKNLSAYSTELGLLKDDVYALKSKQSDIFNDYITYKEIQSLPDSSHIFKVVKSYTIPYYARCIDIVEYRQSKYYKRSEVDDFINRKKERHDFFNIRGETSFETYLNKLKVLNFNGFHGRPYSENKWTHFVSKKLKNNSQTAKTVDLNIMTAVKSATIICNFLDGLSTDNKNKNEVYSLSTSELDFLLKTNVYRYSSFIYQFFREVSQDMILNKVPKNRGFNFNKIENPSKAIVENKKNVSELDESQIYTFDEYIHIFTFLNDIAFHLSNFKLLNKNNDKLKYLSLWLYTSFQLTNTWRTNDICSLPRFDLDYILSENEIYSVDWVYCNNVTPELGRKILIYFKNNEYIMNKNKQINKFRFSDEICVLLATIFILFHFTYKNESIINQDNNLIMYFGTQYNYPEIYTVNKFFQGINITNFKFGNIKMTKSIESYTNIISPSEFGILLAQEQRAHTSKRSTQHYLVTPKQRMDFLSHQLFERGEFGYLFDALLNIVIGTKDRDLFIKERTEIIKSIKYSFGDIHKLESSLRLSIYYTQSEVVDMLYNKTLEECNEILTNIYFNNLPSKEPHIQCLYSIQGCVHSERSLYPKGEGCIGCEYSIPNIYAINSLSNRMKEDLSKYESTENKIIKKKLSMRIFKYKEVLKSAIAKYGKNYIYSCIGIDMSRDDFIKHMKTIKKPCDIDKSPLNSLIEGVNNK